MICNERISIIVPIYNTATFLKQMLQSLAAQTYSNLEVILVNDGSTDDSEAICLAMVTQDERFQYFYQENAGVSKARNTGLEVTTGSYVTFVDSDDWVDPEYIQTMYELLKTTESDISMVSFMSKNWKPSSEEKKVFSGKEAFLELFKGKLFQGNICAKLYKKEIINEIRFPVDIAMGEDMIVAANAFCRAKTVSFNNIPLYHYRWNTNSATQIRFNPKIWSCERTASILYNVVLRNCPQDQWYGAKIACYWNLVIAQKLSGCGRLNQENYLRVKNEILKYHSRDAERVMGLRLKYELRVFLMSRRFYIFFRWLFKNKLAMKLRKLL